MTYWDYIGIRSTLTWRQSWNFTVNICQSHGSWFWRSRSKWFETCTGVRSGICRENWSSKLSFCVKCRRLKTTTAYWASHNNHHVIFVYAPATCWGVTASVSSLTKVNMRILACLTCHIKVRSLSKQLNMVSKYYLDCHWWSQPEDVRSLLNSKGGNMTLWFLLFYILLIVHTYRHLALYLSDSAGISVVPSGHSWI